MEESEKREEVNKNKDKNNLILDNDGKVIDIHEILEDVTNPVVVKIRKLQELDKSISNEMVIEVYQRNAGKVENIEMALDALDKTFITLVKDSNKRLNGIVFEEDGTLTINKEESLE